MKTKVLLALLSFAGAAAAQNQTLDYPEGADWATVSRPAGSIIAGSSHIDNDEFAVPLGRYYNSKFGKTVTATGAVDTLAYSGPATVSSFENMNLLTTQLTGEGYEPIFACVREQCNAAAFAYAFRSPLLAVLGGTGYHNFALESLGAAGGDMRYTAFQKGTEYMCVMTVLNPGRHSGVLLVNVGGSHDAPAAPAKGGATKPGVTKPAVKPVTKPAVLKPGQP